MSNEEKKDNETQVFESQSETKEPDLTVQPESQEVSTETVRRPEVEIDEPKMGVNIFDGMGVKQVPYVKGVGEFDFDTKGLDESEIERIQNNLDAIDSSMAGLLKATTDTGRFSMQLGKAVNDIMVHEDWRRFYFAAEKRNCESAKEFFSVIMPSFSYARLIQVRKGYHFTESMADPFSEMGLPKYLGELHARYGQRYLYGPVYDWAYRNAPAGYSEARKVEFASDLAEASERRAWELTNQNTEKGKNPTADDIAYYSQQAITETIKAVDHFANHLLDWSGAKPDSVPKQPKLPKGVVTRKEKEAEEKRKQLRQKAIEQGLPIPPEAIEPESPAENEPPRLREDVFPLLEGKVLAFAEFLKRWKKQRTTNDGVQAPDFDSDARPFGLDKEQRETFESALTEIDLLCYEMANAMQHYAKRTVAGEKVPADKVQTVKPKLAPNTEETRVTAKP